MTSAKFAQRVVKVKALVNDINPFTQSGLFCLNSLDRSMFSIRDVCLVFIIIMYFFLIFELNANSTDLDQTPRSAASDLGLHCLPVSLLRDSRFKWERCLL